jgi:hypothetical protein
MKIGRWALAGYGFLLAVAAGIAWAWHEWTQADEVWPGAARWTPEDDTE